MRFVAGVLMILAGCLQIWILVAIAGGYLILSGVLNILWKLLVLSEM